MAGHQQNTSQIAIQLPGCFSPFASRTRPVRASVSSATMGPKIERMPSSG